MAAGALTALGLVATAAANPADLLFTVRIDGDANTPTIYVTNNSPTLEITRFEFSIGNTSKNFDGNTTAMTAPPGGGIVKNSPLPGGRSDLLSVTTTGFGPGKTIAVQVDVDQDASPPDTIENYANVFFNNGGASNSVATVYAGTASASRTLPETPSVYTFRGPSRWLHVSSGVEGGDAVKALTIKRDSETVAENVDSVNLEVAHGDRIQISSPKEVYKDINSQYLTASAALDPDAINNQAEERFVANGMSVNNVAQTADPTNYDFEITGDTDVQLRWQHYYALSIRQDFSKTQSQEILAGKPWAGPLASDAAGNPNPPVSKQWVLRGTQPVIQIDGFSVDSFSHPGLDLRYVVKGYRAYGPPNSLVSQAQNNARIGVGGVDIRATKEGTITQYGVVSGSPNETLVTNGVNAHNLETGNQIELTGSAYAPYNGTFTITKVSATTFKIPVAFPGAATGNPVAKGKWRDITYTKNFDFTTVEPRQQIKPAFTMYGPGGITYSWQIQYGVKVSTDDPARSGLAKIYEVNSAGNSVERSVQDGVAWFDPGAHVKVVAAGVEPGVNGLSLTGWVNGDGYYFSAIGEIDPASGLPTSGGPTVVNGGAVAAWAPNTPAGYRGYDIPNLQRPVRTLWRYGAGAIIVNVVIGKHVFEDYPDYATMFTRKPEPIINAVPDPSAVVAGGVTPGPDLMAEWDPVSGRLFPTIPGRFTVPWKPGTDSDQAVEVRVVATLPFDSDRQIRGHYPHIQGTPPVALDPDPDDDFSFKSIKYSTAGASVDANKLFTTQQPGMSVLLFTQLQRVGRGQPREFLQVRVVDTRPWDTNLAAVPKPVPVGSKILDPSVDKAGLGTGYVLDLKGKARYNPFIYDASKLNGLAARDIYDMAQLRADSSSLVVLNKSALPGPVIPVNAHPGVPNNELPIVVWYDDPRRNDSLMWPYVSRIYRPTWPDAASVPQIIIASQYGSEGKSRTNQDQIVAPAIGDVPQATTYDPSRLQAVQIYNQPDFNSPGYNPNEEHALMAPSLRFSDVSPRPPAAYALRTGDLNNSNPNITTGTGRYTSDPFVLVQFFDVAADEVKMNLYSVRKESATGDTPNYRFANNFTATTTNLKTQPFVKMEAGEPVIPFYPLGVAIGASPAPETFGNNFFTQEAYWEDWRGSYWSISGGDKAWFNVSFYYPLAPDFYWPADLTVPPVKVNKSGATYTATYDSTRTPKVPLTGDSVAFLPDAVRAPQSSQFLPVHLPTKVIYKSEWPENPAILKAGETLTFSGGEYHADHPTKTIVHDGVPTTAETPGLPQLLAFASAEVVFDSLNSEAVPDLLKTKWTARVVQALDTRSATLATTAFPSELQPASGRTTVKAGKYLFNELPASLQRRLRYDSLTGKLEFNGLLNDKAIGDDTLTASPPQVYVLEPNIMTASERDAILGLVATGSSARTAWVTAVTSLYNTSRNPESVPGTPGDYLTGLMRLPLYTPQGAIAKDSLGNIQYATPSTPTPMRAFGPGLALVPNANFLDPLAEISTGVKYPDESWVTVVENNDPSTGGSPITPHIIKVDRRERYRGSIKTILSDNVFDENVVLRSTGDFGANADDLIFEWWYRPDDGSLNVPPPDLIPAGQPNPWKVFPDPSGNSGRGRYQMTLKGNPNAPEALLADSWWFVRYRHARDNASGTNWKGTQPDGRKGVNFTWAGAGNSQPFVDADLDGYPDFRAQLAQGWIKRVLDAVNPYEARIRDFEGDAPATVSSMIAEFGARYEGPVALNPDKNVIENVGLIELYETVLNRGKSLSIDLSQPVSTPAISNALQLASTRISDFYTLLGNEAYTDSLDPTIGVGSDTVDPGSVSTSVYAFENEVASPIEEELDLLRGVDDFYARPVYNRLFWNFTKGEGEAAYATNYNITDVNADGFIDEDDAMLMFPQGHGDAWGHYLTALRNQYELLRHPSFNWVSRSESYNLQDIVISVDFFDERKFAATAAAKAKAGAEIVSLTYRDKYVADPKAQWQGYTDSNPDRAWGVDEWGRRAGQGAYFDWVTANALLPAVHPNTTLEGVRKVDRTTNDDIAVISANMNAVQSTLDQADKGYNPLGLARGAQVFDLEPAFIDNSSGGDRRSHFDQILVRAAGMIDNATAVWDNANEKSNMLRQVGNSEADFRNSTFQEDLSYRNQLIQIFGKPYPGTVGPGKLYPAGYDGPDLGLYMYVPVRAVNKDTVPGPSASFATFSSTGQLNGGSLYDAYTTLDATLNSQKIDNATIRNIFDSTFASATNSLSYASNTTSGLFAVNYTDLSHPKVELTGLVGSMPITAAGYTFQAPTTWGARPATGELQNVINQMVQQEAEVAKAIGAWDALSGEIVRLLRLVDSRLVVSNKNQGRDEDFSRAKTIINSVLLAIETGIEIANTAKEVTYNVEKDVASAIPLNLPTGGLAVSPGDALSAARAGVGLSFTAATAGFNAIDDTLKIVKAATQISLDVAENEVNLAKAADDRKLQIREWLKDIEDKAGDEPVLRIAVFKEIQALQALSDQYRTLLDQGGRLVDERAAFNKRVAAQVQRNRYQDMTFRVSRNHALQTYRSSFDLAARYAYLAATAYDYETNFALTDPASPASAFGEIIKSRSLDDLNKALNKLNLNHEVLRGELGLNNEQREIGEISFRRESMRILDSGETQPDDFPTPGEDSDSAWKAELQKARVPDLWQVREFRENCRPFAAASNSAGQPVPQPGIVLRFSSDISSGKNFFGKPLAGGDHSYSASHYATKIFGMGVTFDGYNSDDLLGGLAASPRVYFVPAGMDIMRVSRTDSPDDIRTWKVVEQTIPVPFAATGAQLQQSGYIPLLDALNGKLGDNRRFADFRAYPDSAEEPTMDTRLLGRSIWNTEWLLIIPGATLNADPNVGLDRFVDQVSDIKMIFDSYGQSGN